MHKKLLVALTLVWANLTFAQMDPLGTFNRYIAENWAGQYQRIGQYKVKGPVFLYGESFNGKIRMEGGMFINNEKILYNLYEQKVGPDVNGEIFQSDQHVEEFILDLPAKYGGRSLLFKHSSFYGDDKLKTYLNVLTDGSKFGFLKVYRIRLAPDPTNSYDKEAKLFEQYNEYYLYRHGNPGELVKVKLRKKDIENELLPAKGAAAVIDKADTDYTSEDDVRILIMAINRE